MYLLLGRPGDSLAGEFLCSVDTVAIYYVVMFVTIATNVTLKWLQLSL